MNMGYQTSCTLTPEYALAPLTKESLLAHWKKLPNNYLQYEDAIYRFYKLFINKSHTIFQFPPEQVPKECFKEWYNICQFIHPFTLSNSPRILRACAKKIQQVIHLQIEIELKDVVFLQQVKQEHKILSNKIDQVYDGDFYEELKVK
jgi:hypothetical protein